MLWVLYLQMEIRLAPWNAPRSLRTVCLKLFTLSFLYPLTAFFLSCKRKSIIWNWLRILSPWKVTSRPKCSLHYLCPSPCFSTQYPPPNALRPAALWRAGYSSGESFLTSCFQINHIIKIPEPTQLITNVTGNRCWISSIWQALCWALGTDCPTSF